MRQSRTRKKTPRGLSGMPGMPGMPGMVVSTQPTASGGIGYMPDMGGDPAGGCVDCHDYFEIHV